MLDRPRAAVRADDVAALERERRLLAIEPLGGELEHLAGGVGRRRAHRRAHRGERRGAAGDRGEGAARRVADLHLDPVERQPELLGCDLRHRRACAGADVLHRGDDVARPSEPSRTHA